MAKRKPAKKAETKKSETVAPPKIGRPTKFTDGLAEQIYKLAASGMTDQQISDHIGINRTTLVLWKSKHEVFSNTMRDHKGMADDLVEIACFQRAVGMTTINETEYLDDAGEKQTLKKTIVLPPDPRAQEFWLRNRRSHEWNNAQEINFNFGTLTDDDLIKQAEEAKSRLKQLQAEKAE